MDEIETAILRRRPRWIYDMLTEHITTDARMPANARRVEPTTPEAVMRVMEAMTRSLVGDKGDARGAAFNSEIIVIVGGSLPIHGLTWLSSVARLNQKHVLHISIDPDCILPVVALAYRRNERVEVYERCMLVLKAGEDRVMIVPDSFRNGAFQFTRALRLKRRSAPASIEATSGSMARAYDRFYGLLETAPIVNRAPLPITMS